MPPKCKICDSDKKSEIEAALRAGATLRALSVQYGYTISSIQRHTLNHMDALPVRKTKQDIKRLAQAAKRERAALVVKSLIEGDQVIKSPPSVAQSLSTPAGDVTVLDAVMASPSDLMTQKKFVYDQMNSAKLSGDTKMARQWATEYRQILELFFKAGLWAQKQQDDTRCTPDVEEAINAVYADFKIGGNGGIKRTGDDEEHLRGDIEEGGAVAESDGGHA
jgi:hypothetical protein